METRKNSTKPDWLTDGGLFLSLYYKRRRNKREEIILNSLCGGVVFLSFFNVLCLCRLIMAPHRLRECSFSFRLFTFLSLSLSWASSLRGKSFPLFLVWRLCYFDTHTTNNSILRPHVQGKKRPRVTYLIFFFVFRRFSYFSFFKWILLVFWTLLTKSGSPAAKGVDGRIIFHLTPPKCIFIFFFLSFFLSFF